MDNIPEILHNDIYVFEKLDGGNCQFRKIEGRIRCGNRANFIEGRSFDRGWFPAFRKWAASNYSLYQIPENLIFFGEWLSRHEIQYSEDKMNKFYLIDILDISSEKFIDYKEAVDIAKGLCLDDINFLDVIKQGRVSMAGLDDLMVKSSYYDGIREGLVIKDYKRQLFAKKHSPFYQEILSDRKLPPEKRFITERKIKKVISSLKDDKPRFDYSDLIEYMRKNINEEHRVLLDKRKIDESIKKVMSMENIEKALAD